MKNAKCEINFQLFVVFCSFVVISVVMYIPAIIVIRGVIFINVVSEAGVSDKIGINMVPVIVAARVRRINGNICCGLDSC